MCPSAPATDFGQEALELIRSIDEMNRDLIAGKPISSCAPKKQKSKTKLTVPVEQEFNPVVVCSADEMTEEGRFNLECLKELGFFVPTTEDVGKEQVVPKTPEKELQLPQASKVSCDLSSLVLEPNWMELLRQELEIDEEGLSEADKIVEECQREHEKFSYASEMPSTSFSPTPRPRMVHKCHTCQENFASRQSMLRHVQRKHPSDISKAKESRDYDNGTIAPYKCKSCGKGFMKTAALAEHNRRHVAVKNCPCYIQGCPKTFSRPSEVKKHVKLVHRC